MARQLRTKDGKIVRSLFAEAQLDDSYRPVFQAFITRRRRGIRQLIEAAMETGQIDQDSDIELIVDEVYGPLLYRWSCRH